MGDTVLRRDLLLEYLHLLQDHYGCLFVDHLAALAEEMRLSQSEVYEVATFYAHFDVVGDSDVAPTGVTVRVCDSITCTLFGGDSLLKELRAEGLEEVRVIRAHCMGGCDCAPVAAVAQYQVDHATVCRWLQRGAGVHKRVPENRVSGDRNRG